MVCNVQYYSITPEFLFLLTTFSSNVTFDVVAAGGCCAHPSSSSSAAHRTAKYFMLRSKHEAKRKYMHWSLTFESNNNDTKTATFQRFCGLMNIWKRHLMSLAIQFLPVGLSSHFLSQILEPLM